MKVSFTDSLDKNISNILKGLAIILMITHHCFGFPAWYVAGISYSPTLGHGLNYWICNSTKICVGIFAFLTGWAYFYNKHQTFKYGIKKIINLLEYYWVHLFIIFLPLAIILKYYPITIVDLLENLFAVGNNIVIFAWYVYFYIFVMLILPLTIKILKKNFLFDLIFSMFCCYSFIILLDFADNDSVVTICLRNCSYYFPCIIIGYLFAKYKIFNIIENHLCFISARLKFLYFIPIILVMICRNIKPLLHGFNLDAVYVPILIFFLVEIIINYKLEHFNCILKILGKHSLNIWFLHSIFFSTYTKGVFQKIAYLPHIPVLVVAWVIVICLPFSILINFIVKKFNNLIINLSLSIHYFQGAKQ